MPLVALTPVLTPEIYGYTEVVPIHTASNKLGNTLLRQQRGSSLRTFGTKERRNDNPKIDGALACFRRSHGTLSRTTVSDSSPHGPSVQGHASGEGVAPE